MHKPRVASLRLFISMMWRCVQDTSNFDRRRRPRRHRRRVSRMQGKLVSRYLAAAAAIKRGLRSRGGLPMAGLLPTTCHPGSRGGCAGYSATRRRSVMLSATHKRGSLVWFSRFHERTAGTAPEKISTSIALSYVSNSFPWLSRRYFDTRDHKDATFIAWTSRATQDVSVYVWHFVRPTISCEHREN